MISQKTTQKSKKEDFVSKYNEICKQVKDSEEQRIMWLYEKLTEAYVYGKKVYGDRRFGYRQLGDDVGLSEQTILRIMSLKNANKKTMDRVKKGEISVRKLQYILKRNAVNRQDEIIDYVIKNNLTLSQIQRLTNFNSREEFADNKTKISLQKGFSQRESAYRSLNVTLERIRTVVLIKPKDLPKQRKDELKEKLDTTIELLNKYKKSLETGRHWLE